MNVGNKVTLKYGTNVGTVVRKSSGKVWVKWDHETEPIPYRAALVRAA